MEEFLIRDRLSHRLRSRRSQLHGLAKQRECSGV
jgi:hypothetical protein